MGGSQVLSLFLAPNGRITEDISGAGPDVDSQAAGTLPSDEGVSIMRTGGVMEWCLVVRE